MRLLAPGAKSQHRADAHIQSLVAEVLKWAEDAGEEGTTSAVVRADSVSESAILRTARPGEAPIRHPLASNGGCCDLLC